MGALSRRWGHVGALLAACVVLCAACAVDAVEFRTVECAGACDCDFFSPCVWENGTLPVVTEHLRYNDVWGIAPNATVVIATPVTLHSNVFVLHDTALRVDDGGVLHLDFPGRVYRETFPDGLLVRRDAQLRVDVLRGGALNISSGVQSVDGFVDVHVHDGGVAEIRGMVSGGARVTLRADGVVRLYRDTCCVHTAAVWDCERFAAQRASLLALQSQLPRLWDLSNMYTPLEWCTAFGYRLWCAHWDVNGISLQSLDLHTLPEELAALDTLRSLDLQSNKLRDLPDWLATNMSQLTSLELSINKLGTIPAAVFDLVHLESLDVAANQITELPASICQLARLTDLTLTNNVIPALPIACLTELRTLQISENALVELPPDITKLRKLSALYVGNNALRTLPDSMGELTTLQTLVAMDNQLTSLPDAMGALVNLEFLELSRNAFTELPRCVSAMVSLRTLTATECRLRALPPLDALVQLRSVDLSNNLLPTIARMGEWRSLSVLKLENNRLTELPDDLGHAPLRTLSVVNNELTRLPSTLGMLSNLETLDVMNNMLPALPDSLGDLAQLQSIDATANELATLPDSLGNLASLTRLTLRENKLTRLPDSFCRLHNLANFVDLNNNALRALPECIGELVALQSLTAEFNQLETCPRSMRNLRSLQTLALSGNALEELPDDMFAHMTALQSLSLRQNGLRALPSSLAAATGLRYLFLAENALTSLPDVFARMGALSTVELSNNMLTYIPPSLGECAALTYVNVEGNHIEELPRTLAFPVLQYLYISDNALREMDWPFERWRKLSGINAARNRIHTVTASLCNATALTSIDVSGNELTELPECFPNLRSLVKVIVNDNRLRSLPQRMASLPLLSTLNVANNELVSFPAGEADDVAYPLLTQLLARRNRLATIEGISYLPAVQVIDLAHNALTVVPEGWHVPHVLTMDLSHNNLHDVSGVTTSSLQTLDVSNNRLSRLAKNWRPTKLGSLNIANNAFVSLDSALTSVLSSLMTLNVAGNNLNMLSLGHIAALSSISFRDMNNGEVEWWPLLVLAELPSLTFVDGQHSGAAGTLAPLENTPHLEFLFMQGNPALRNGTYVAYTHSSEARAEHRGLPSFLSFDDEYAPVQERALHECPKLRSAPDWNIQVAHVDATYYNHSACRCIDGYFGVPPRCLACPSGGVCVDGATRPLAQRDHWGELVACDAQDPSCVSFAQCGETRGCVQDEAHKFAFYHCQMFGAGETACRTSGVKDTAADPRAVFGGDQVNGCERGHSVESRLCSKCASGWYRNGGDCLQCPSHSAVLLPMAALLGLGMLYVATLLSVSSSSVAPTPMRMHHVPLVEGGGHTDTATRGTRGGDGATLSILILHLQLVSLLSALATPLPSLLHGSSQASSASVFSVPALDCVVDGLHFEARMYVTLLTPVALLVLCAAAYFVGRWTFARQRVDEWYDANISVLLLLCTFAYIPVCLFSFQALPCHGFGAGSFMLHAPDIECNGTAHRRMLVFASLSIVFFVFGAPLALLYRVYLEHRVPNTRFLRRFGRFLLVYRKECWYWRGVYYLRAVAITAALATFGSGSPLLPASVFAVLTLFALVQHQYHPFALVRDNTLQIWSLGLTLVNFHVALTFFAYGADGPSAQAVDVLVSLANVLLVATLIRRLVRRWQHLPSSLLQRLTNGMRARAQVGGDVRVELEMRER